jgi:hypothetical protein
MGKNIDKIWEKYRQNLEKIWAKIWTKYGKNMYKIWKSMGKIWTK